MSEEDIVLVARIGLAAALGYAIGFEREARGKAAGQRTFALVALGAAAFTGYAVQHLPDAGRVIQGVITGIGFLGAGLIFRAEGGSVQGLTTAASAWAIAAIGVLAGSGAYWPALITTVLVLAILELNYVLRPSGSQEGKE